MHYPFWYVPGLTSPMWIAIVAVIHVYVAMYAVGGAVLLVFQTRLAYKTRDKEYLDYLRRHTWFFLLLTVVYGSLLGIGIWWTIGLASPLATEELIHIFVLGWAMEYVTFILEIIAIFIFFYYWGRLSESDHLKTGWIYAGAAFGSLVIITAITAFQLNAGNWRPENGFWAAMFNPQAIPQIAARTGGSLLLGALYFFLHSSLFLGNHERLRTRVGRQSANWAMIGAALTIIGGFAWLLNLPASGEAALVGAAVLNVLMTIIFLLTAGVVIMMYFGPIRNPKWLTPGFTILFFGAGLAATGTGEFIREAVRKPYIVHNRVLGNQIRPDEIPQLRNTGYLNGGVWTRAYISHKFPQVMTTEGNEPQSDTRIGQIDGEKLLNLPAEDRRLIGQTIFMYHCNDCHAVEGYSSVAQLTRGWNDDMIYNLVLNLDRFHYFMPPWSGTDAEALLLTEYIQEINHPYPAGLQQGLEEAR